MDSASLKDELKKHLNGNMAFVPVTEIVCEIGFEQIGIRPGNLRYSFYEVFYHLVFAQRDILDFIKDETYRVPNWPDDYWPGKQAPADETDWENLKNDYLKDCAELKEWISGEGNVLEQPVKNATKPDQSLFRELLLILTHTAYHTGQLLIILRLLDLHD